MNDYCGWWFEEETLGFEDECIDEGGEGYGAWWGDGHEFGHRCGNGSRYGNFWPSMRNWIPQGQ